MNTTPPTAWRYDRARLTDALRTGAVALLLGVAGIFGLSAWALAGHAGSPARIEVREGNVLLPAVPGSPTNAYFPVVNTGGAPDRLLSATVRGASPGPAEITRHRMNEANGAYREPNGPLTVPASTELAMSPFGTALTVTASPRWRPGDRITFVLTFERAGPITADAVVTPLRAVPSQ
ncbi:copper chaperone PCu(A)C [Streptomyces sp. NRRL F-5065]|uniref:copper chaperone PCu(A)C n=1 Tax=Streptomyces sp. NRRL F-5065 TaxID=1463855 RepID=UPI0004BEB4A3|nr:copper chaperone PCu(A)C [Streptomyces sp. NRRL F-5065]